jgi:hypothetical protein
MAHTPGPWEWWTSCSWKRLTSKDERGHWMREGNVLCPAVASDGHPVLDVSAADMALIAAAPELLVALKAVIQADDQFRASMSPDTEKDPLTLACDAARVAVAKAEGQS